MKSVNINILHGDCVERMKAIEENSVGSIICDPPYGISFMNKEFDKLGDGESQREWHRAWLKEAYRVLQKGGIIKAFSATRTYHHLAQAMEDVGFSQLSIEAWCYGSGFPKSLNISKSIDKNLGKEREIQGYKVKTPSAVDYQTQKLSNHIVESKSIPIQDKPASEESARFDGYGTALKPSWEPFVVGVK